MLRRRARDHHVGMTVRRGRGRNRRGGERRRGRAHPGGAHPGGAHAHGGLSAVRRLHGAGVVRRVGALRRLRGQRRSRGGLVGALPVGAVGALLRWLLGVAAVVRGRSTVAVVGTGGVSGLRGRGGVAAVCAAVCALRGSRRGRGWGGWGGGGGAAAGGGSGPSAHDTVAERDDRVAPVGNHVQVRYGGVQLTLRHENLRVGHHQLRQADAARLPGGAGEHHSLLEHGVKRGRGNLPRGQGAEPVLHRGVHVARADVAQGRRVKVASVGESTRQNAGERAPRLRRRVGAQDGQGFPPLG